VAASAAAISSCPGLKAVSVGRSAFARRPASGVVPVRSQDLSGPENKGTLANLEMRAQTV